MRSSIIVLIAVVSVGSIVISLGFLTDAENDEAPQIVTQYEKLEKYRNELERINQYNMQVLEDLERQIQNSDDENLARLNEEIAVINRVINDNKAELEQVTAKLSQMEPAR